MRASLLLYCFFSFLPAFASGQDFSICKHIRLEDGLPSNGVRSILQDKLGFMWFATFDGLCKYDGYELSVFRNSPEDKTSLSNNRLNAMAEDPAGNIWLATRYEGLSVYDQKKGRFINFRHQGNKKSSLSSNVVWTVYADRRGRMWVGTWDGGLDLFQGRDSSFIHFTSKNGLASNNVFSLVEDDHERLWIGSDGEGIDCLDLRTRQIRHFQYDGKNRKIKVNSLLYKEGALWIATREHGLCRFVPATGKSEWYVHASDPDRNDPQVHSLLGSDNVSGLYDSGDRWIWVLEERRGINIIDTKTGQSHSYGQGKENIGLSSNTYFKIYRDRQGNLWMAGGSGIDLLPRQFSNIRSIQYDPARTNSPSSRHITKILEDSKGRMWIGTDRGLDCYLPQQGVYRHFEPGANDPRTINGENITALFEDRQQRIWIGTFNGGLNLYDEKRQTFRSFCMGDDGENSILSNTVWSIYEDREGNFWVGTDSGLELLDRKTFLFKHFCHSDDDPRSISDNRITAIAQDSEGELWFGTVYGLNKLEKHNGGFTHYFHNLDDASSLPSNLVRYLFVDSRKRLWVASEYGGLSLFDNLNRNFRSLSEKDGFLSTSAYSIAEDKSGKLWIGTSNGLSNYDPTKKTCKTYSEAHGLRSRSFNWGSVCQLRSGQLAFGGNNGISLFAPDSIVRDAYLPRVMICRLKVDDQELLPDLPISGKIIIKQTASFTDEIRLSYQHNNLSVDFASDCFDFPSSVTFAYRLKGYQDRWTSVGSKHRYAIFSSLPPGEYEFQVKAANCDGVWSQQLTSLRIVVNAPFWMRTWFPIFLGFVSVLVLVAFYQFQLARNKKKELELERLVDRRTTELRMAYEDLKIQSEYIQQQNDEISQQNEEILKQTLQLEEHRNMLEIKVQERTQELSRAKRELDIAYSLKSAFLQNMSHEIRTPMNAIVGFAGMMVRRKMNSEQLQEACKIIEQNTYNLTKVVEDILYISQLQTGEVLVEYKDHDVLPLMEELHSTFSNLKLQEGKTTIELQMDVPEGLSEMVIETDLFALKQILWNLLSNGVKYTEEGSVSFGFRVLGENGTEPQAAIEFWVRDTGIGIDSSDLDKIYDLFRKIEKPEADKLYRGIGLGLSISEKLVNYMGGQISVSSQLGKGSRFTVSFPIRRANA